MRSLVTSTLIVACIALTAAPASSQQRCLEGRTATGKCVNPDLARDMRTGTIVYTQPKLSMTNPPILPSEDGQYYVARDHHEISNLHGGPPIVSPYGQLTYDPPGTPTTPVPLGPRP